MAVRFNFQKTIILTKRRDLKQFLYGLFEKEGKILGPLNYVFCDDTYILNINQGFLMHNYFTDIITFDLTEPGSTSISGEIYISVDTVSSNAIKFKADLENELHRVIFHGALHLCGYKDKSSKDKELMRKKENYYLKRYFESR